MSISEKPKKDLCPICNSKYNDTGLSCSNSHVREPCPICKHAKHEGMCNKRCEREYARGDYIFHDDYICKCKVWKVNK